MAEDYTERRRGRRFPVVAPVVVSWKAHNGTRKNVQGTTRDICLGGMYVASAIAPPVASVVRCEVLLPKLEGAAPPSRFVLQSVGRVVRSGKRDAAGFGVSTRVAVLADSEPRMRSAPAANRR